MIADLKPYPAYKDSGVPWLGEVPEHWEVRRLKSSVAHINERTNAQSPDDIYVALEDVESWTGRLRVRDGEVEFDSQVKRFHAQDVLFGKLRPYLAKVVRPARSGVCVGEFLVLRATRNSVLPAFLEGTLRSAPVIHAINSSTYGAKMPRAEWIFVGRMPFPLPPLSEQSAIVRFLDWANRRIRQVIRARQKLIKLLEEQKQAIIHRAVTRGLDPNVRLKPSGVQWLGEIPEHWEVRLARYYFREVDERSTNGMEELLSVSHITGVTPRTQKNVTMFMASTYVGHKLCRPGDLVINTMWAWMGALGIARHVGIVSPSYGVYRPVRGSRLLGDYADLLLRTRPYISEYLCCSTGIRPSRLRLYPEQFLRIRLACPPPEEQRAILHWVTIETAAAERAIAGARGEIDLLHEYRTRLIADVVAGKLDVRELAAKLPDETEESDTLDEIEAAEGSEEPVNEGDVAGDLEEAEE
jgi:type I restriction enzyme S subunit